MDAAATKKNKHSIPVNQFELVFGFQTDKILNFENPMAAGGTHCGIAAQRCRKGSCIHVDFNGAGHFDILAAGLGSSSYIFEFLQGFSHLSGSLLLCMAFLFLEVAPPGRVLVRIQRGGSGLIAMIRQYWSIHG